MERLYLLVRDDLPVGKQAAQLVHAMAQWMIEHPNESWKNDYVVCLKVKNIQKWIYKLEHLEAKFSTFAEPDLDFQITALASNADAYYFRNLKLVGS